MYPYRVIECINTCGYDGAWQFLVFTVEKIVELAVHALRSGESASGLLYGSETFNIESTLNPDTK